MRENLTRTRFDHFVKERLKAQKYVRYVDDFAVFSDDRRYLAGARREIEGYLAGLRLKIHPVKSQLFETRRGLPWLSYFSAQHPSQAGEPAPSAAAAAPVAGKLSLR